jgi:hypothetical protein
VFSMGPMLTAAQQALVCSFLALSASWPSCLS